MSSVQQDLTDRSMGSGWSDLAFGLTAVTLGVAGFLGAAYAAWAGFGELLHFFGETATPEEVAESRRLFRLAAVVGAVVPLVGLSLALWVRRRGITTYFVVLLVLGVLFAGLVGLDQRRTRTPEPGPERGPRACQESSGGDNRCPGG